MRSSTRAGVLVPTPQRQTAFFCRLVRPLLPAQLGPQCPPTLSSRNCGQSTMFLSRPSAPIDHSKINPQAVPIRSWIFPRLPTEICEQIIDAVAGVVAQDDSEWVDGSDQVVVSIRECTLVCRSWLPRSRRHLYHHVRLDGPSRTRRFFSALSTSSSLGSLVKKFTLDGFKTLKAEDPHCNWIYEAVSGLPSYLKNLDVLQLRDLPLLHPTFPIRFSKFVTVTTLVVRSLHDYNSFCEILWLSNKFPRLQHLTIQQCNWRRPVSTFTRRQPTLSSLYVNQTIDRRDDVLGWLSVHRRPPHPLAEITWRNIPSYPNQPQITSSCWPFLRSCSPTLQRLTVDMDVRPHLEWNLGKHEYFCYNTL